MKQKDNFEVRKGNLHFKCTPLRRNKSEPLLTKRTRKPEFRHNKLKKNLKNNPQVHKRYPDAVNKLNIQSIVKMKTNDKFKSPTKIVSKKSLQKIKPNCKQGFFAGKLTSMWLYAKSFLGFNSNASTSVENNIKYADNITKAKTPSHVTNKSMIHDMNKDPKENYNILEKDNEKQKKIIEIYRYDRNRSKTNNKLCNEDQKGKEILQGDNKSKVNVNSTGKELIEAEMHCELSDKSKEDLTYGKETSEDKLITKENEQLEVKEQILKDINVFKSIIEPIEKDEIQMEEQMLLKIEPSNNEIEFSEHENLTEAESIITKVPIEEEIEQEENMLVETDKQIEHLENILVETKEQNEQQENTLVETIKEIAMNENPKQEIFYETNIELTQNQSQADKNKEIEVKKIIIIKDKSKEGITIEINTNQSVCEVFTKTNCHKSGLNEKSATIIMEIKNKNNIKKDNLNVNFTTVNVPRSEETSKENIVTLLQNYDTKLNRISSTKAVDRKKRTPSKATKTTLKVAKTTPKVTKTAPKVTSTPPLTRSQNKNNKKPLETKAQPKVTRKPAESKPSKRQNSKHRHDVKRRKCSICRGYVSTDHSEERKPQKNKCNRERCNICKKQVACLYHHTKKHHPNKKTIRQKCTKTTKNKSTHNFQKRKRTLTVCTNSRRNSFKIQNKKFKKSNKKICNNSESDSDRESKVLSWCYLHYALNAVQHNEKPSGSKNTDINNPFTISYEDYCNVNRAISKANPTDSDNSRNNDKWNDDFQHKKFSKHQNTSAECVSENPTSSSSYFSARSSNFKKLTSVANNLDIPNSSPQKSTNNRRIKKYK